MIQSTIAIILVLGGLIFFHELGHFLVARFFKIGVSTFSLGFGPRIAGASWGKTDYRVSAVPLGGYVHLVGESPEAELPEGFEDQESFSQRPPWQRMLVVAAGPVFNFLLALIIYWGIFWAQGQQAILPEIGEVQPKSPAYEAGIKPGDKVVSINGDKIDYWSQMAERIRTSQNAPLNLKVSRDKKLLTIEVQPELQTRKNIFGEEVKVPMLGITAAGTTVNIHLGPLQAAGAAVNQTWKLIKLTVEGIVKLVERIIPLETIGGPIMIAQLVSEQAQQSVVSVLALAALISINLGLLNLLPIPVLDGGHIIFFAIETVLGRPLSPKWQQLTMKIGLSLLILLMALAVYNDLQRILQPN
jgi:regulator of sigma E protease